jgi:hypothetical protein
LIGGLYYYFIDSGMGGWREWTAKKAPVNSKGKPCRLGSFFSRRLGSPQHFFSVMKVATI